MLTLKQRVRRQQGIGASDVGAILGLSKYKTALDVYLEKVDLSPPSEDSEAAEWGHRLEDVIAQKYAAVHPGVSLELSDTVAHPQHDWVLATPDRIVREGGAAWLLEIKTREEHTLEGFGEPGTDQVPDDVLAQCQWQMFVTGLPKCDVALLVNGRRFRLYHIPASPDLQRTLFERVEAFWFGHVEAKVPPPVTAADNRKMASLFPRNTAPMLDGDADTFARVRCIAELKAQVKALEAQQDEEEAQLKLAIGAAEGFLFPGGSKATWTKNKDSEVVDYKTMIGVLNVPEDILKAHTTTKPGARVLRLSIKEGK